MQSSKLAISLTKQILYSERVRTCVCAIMHGSKVTFEKKWSSSSRPSCPASDGHVILLIHIHLRILTIQIVPQMKSWLAPNRVTTLMCGFCMLDLNHQKLNSTVCGPDLSAKENKFVTLATLTE